MSPLFKKIIPLFVLMSFLAVVFLSFPMMMGAANGSMPEGCPFAATGLSLCPTNTLAMAVHHISSYHSFLTATMHSEIANLLASLLLAAVALLVTFMRPPLWSRPTLAGFAYNRPLTDSPKRKIARWLSLLEQSPSLA